MMIDREPLGPDGLGDLQREGVDLRDLERKFCDRPDENSEAGMIEEAHWWVQPAWVKYLTLGLGIPAGVVWTYEIQTANISFLDSPLMFVCFGALGLIAVLQLFFIIRAYWRMDI